MTMHLDVWLEVSFPEKRFASKLPSVLRTEVPDLMPRSGRLIFQNSRNGWHECVTARSQFVQPGGARPPPKHAYLGKPGLRKLAAGRRGRGAHSRVPQVDRLNPPRCDAE